MSICEELSGKFPNHQNIHMSRQHHAIDITLASRLAEVLQQRQQRLVTVESCTGGMVAACLTGLPGSSQWFEGDFVTYRLSAKMQMVGVPEATLARHGAVSEPTARAMAEGGLLRSSADISVAITGVAGPDGGDMVSPVGTVWFAWALRDPEIYCVQTLESHFDGDRQSVRIQAVNLAIAGLLEVCR
jgi:nicotinamide-nucleotide amidase